MAGLELCKDNLASLGCAEVRVHAHTWCAEVRMRTCVRTARSTWTPATHPGAEADGCTRFLAAHPFVCRQFRSSALVQQKG